VLPPRWRLHFCSALATATEFDAVQQNKAQNAGFRPRRRIAAPRKNL